MQQYRGFAAVNTVTYGVIYTAIRNDRYVRYLDRDRNELWSSPVYYDIFPSFGENIWDPAGKNAAYISKSASQKNESQYAVNIFNVEDLKLTKREVPQLDGGDMMVSAAWEWSPFSNYLNVTLPNKQFRVGNTVYKGGNGFLINILDTEIKPLCIKNESYFKGLVIDRREPYMLFTTINERKNATIWLLDIQHWEAMDIFEYPFESIHIDMIGVINN